MTDITRNEMEARFAATDARREATEARMEARFSELNGKIDRLTEGFAIVRSEVHDVRAELREVKADNKTTRWTIAITVVTAVLAGAGAIWTTQNNLLAAFQAGLARQSLSATAAAQTVERAPSPTVSVAPFAKPPAVSAGHRR